MKSFKFQPMWRRPTGNEVLQRIVIALVSCALVLATGLTMARWFNWPEVCVRFVEAAAAFTLILQMTTAHEDVKNEE